jgi:hypothetical protein
MTGGLPDLTTEAERSRKAFTIVDTELEGLRVSYRNDIMLADLLPIIRNEEHLLLRSDDDIPVVGHDIGNEGDNR